MKTKYAISLLLIFCIYACSSNYHLMEYLPGDAKLPSLLVLGDTTYHKMVDDDVLASPDSTAVRSEPVVVRNVQPIYPVLEHMSGKEADVFVKACVTKEGTVRQVRVFKSTDNQFNRAAAEAAMQWLFKPSLLKGKPVSAWVMIPFRFRIK